MTRYKKRMYKRMPRRFFKLGGIKIDPTQEIIGESKTKGRQLYSGLDYKGKESIYEYKGEPYKGEKSEKFKNPKYWRRLKN